MADDEPITHSVSPLVLPAASYDFQVLHKQVEHARTLKTASGHDNAMKKALTPISETTAYDPDAIALPEGTVLSKTMTEAGEEVLAPLAIPADTDPTD